MAWHSLSNPFARRPWLWAAVALTVVSILFVALTGMRPAYDAYGWLVWGREAIHWDLDTNAAPSWKPLTFLFTTPFALTGPTALWLWMETAVAASLAGAVFAGRIAYKLTGRSPGRPYAPFVAAAFAAFGVLGIDSYWHYVLIAYADPMIVTLCLAAIDCRLSGRPRLAWLLLVLASLGRPEAWPVAAVYGLWAWRAVPSMRRAVAAGFAVIPVLWFGIPAVTSHSWLISGEVALDSANALHGNKLAGLLDRFLGLYELPMWLTALFAVATAIIRRDRTWLVLTGAALSWMATELAFVLHGWPATPRYMFEPAAVMVVLAGAAVGRVLAVTPHRLVFRIAAPAAVVTLLVLLAAPVRTRVRIVHSQILAGHTWARQIHRLHAVIAKEGGPNRVLACGQAVTDVPYQSILAWELHQNVVGVGWDPPSWFQTDQPVVWFQPVRAGWIVRPVHTAAADRKRCARLHMHTAFD